MAILTPVTLTGWTALKKLFLEVLILCYLRMLYQVQRFLAVEWCEEVDCEGWSWKYWGGSGRVLFQWYLPGRYVSSLTDLDSYLYSFFGFILEGKLTRVYPKVPEMAAWREDCKVQLYRYFVRQSSEVCRHEPLCCFSTSVYCCYYCCLLRYRLNSGTFGYTLLCVMEL
jgi:hypothetical protein